MINCPEIDPDIRRSEYNLIFDILAILSAIIHVYTMYCIVFRSSVQMRTYRWYLLWHQVVSFLGDFWINAVTKPMIYVPLPMGYLNGLGDGIMHPKVGLAAGQFFVVLACVTTLHLLLYRYTCVSSMGHFPLYLKLILSYNYVNPFINLVATATASDQTEKVLTDWAKEYSCVSPTLMSIPHLWAYDRMECMIRTLSVIWYDFINYAIVLPYFVKATFKAIDVKIMSEATRRMQRNFLIQLLLQASIPTIFVMIPIFVIASAVMFDIFAGRYLNDVVFISLSLFGVSGAIVLIIIIPNYHWWWKKPTTSAVASMLSTSNLR